MTTSRTLVVAALCAISAGMINVTLAAPPTKDVNVVNTPDVNVVSMPPINAQVTGTIDTNVVNTPDVNVVNTADVNVVNTPGVTIENGPNNPVPVVQRFYQRVPFQKELIITIPDGFPFFGGGDFIPDGQLLVIENVTLHSSIPAEQNIKFWRIKTRPEDFESPFIEHYLSVNPPLLANLSQENIYNINNLVRLYSYNSYAVEIGIISPQVGEISFHVTLSGYLLSSSSPSLEP